MTRRPSNLVAPLPADNVASVQAIPQCLSTYEQVAQRVSQVKEILGERGIRLGSGSSLDQLLRRAEALDRQWRSGAVPSLSMLCDTAHVNRLTEAVLVLRNDAEVRMPLTRMAKNVMMPENRRQSQGKDALWEIVLLAHLRKVGLTARFEDPPDIVVTLDGTEYPVACKKVWTETGVTSHIRKAGQQLRRFGGSGVIALNLDDLVRPGVLLQQTDRHAAGVFLDQFNLAFIERHRNALQQAIMTGRCDGIWVSVCTPANLVQEASPFNLYTQTTIWHLAGASEASKARLYWFAIQAAGGTLQHVGQA